MNFKIKFLSLFFVVLFFSSAFAKNIAVIPFTNITKQESNDWIGARFDSTLNTI